MNLKMNEYGEFVDDFDPYGIEREGAYAEVLGRIPVGKGALKGHPTAEELPRCDFCGKPIVGRNNGAVYCSGRCKMAAYRRRKNEGMQGMR